MTASILFFLFFQFFLCFFRLILLLAKLATLGRRGISGRVIHICSAIFIRIFAWNLPTYFQAFLLLLRSFRSLYASWPSVLISFQSRPETLTLELLPLRRYGCVAARLELRFVWSSFNLGRRALLAVDRRARYKSILWLWISMCFCFYSILLLIWWIKLRHFSFSHFGILGLDWPFRIIAVGKSGASSPCRASSNVLTKYVESSSCASILAQCC